MRRWPGSVWIPIATLFSLSAIAVGATAQQSRERYDAAVLSLQRAVTPQRDGSHLSRLFGLRQLHDPSLEPLLRQLVHDREWQVQVHAILGLAEIREPHRIDPWLVTQLEHDAGEAAVANALDMGLVGREQIHELLGWQELPAVSRLLLVGELILAGEDVDTAKIAAFANSAQFRVSGLASILMARLGDLAPLSACNDRLATVPRRERERHIFKLLESIRQFKVTEGLPWIHRLLDDPKTSDSVRYWSILAALELDTASALPYWHSALGDEPSHRDRLRFGTLLLVCGGDVPASAYERLGLEDDLLRRMANAGLSIRSDEDPTDALIALIDAGHLESTNWAMKRVADLPTDQATRVYLQLIDTVDLNPARSARAVESAAQLFEINPAAVTQRLIEEEDDTLKQEVMLLGLFETRSPEAGKAAGNVRRIGAGRADTLALMLIARHAETLEQNDLDMLGRIAGGGGRVSDGLRVQAAWLYLKHSRALDRAIAQVMDIDTP